MTNISRYAAEPIRSSASGVRRSIRNRLPNLPPREKWLRSLSSVLPFTDAFQADVATADDGNNLLA